MIECFLSGSLQLIEFVICDVLWVIWQINFSLSPTGLEVEKNSDSMGTVAVSVSDLILCFSILFCNCLGKEVAVCFPDGHTDPNHSTSITVLHPPCDSTDVLSCYSSQTALLDYGANPSNWTSIWRHLCTVTVYLQALSQEFSFVICIRLYRVHLCSDQSLLWCLLRWSPALWKNFTESVRHS